MTESEISSCIRAIDHKSIDEIKNLKKNNIFKDIILEIYKNNLLTEERLKYIVKNSYEYFNVSSALIKKLLKDDNLKLLDIIFDNILFFDNEFIIKLLLSYKNKMPLSIKELEQQIENYKLLTKDKIDNFNSSSHIYLVTACIDGKFYFVKFFKELGMDINKIYKNGSTPLFYACRSGKINLVQYLIEHGADINKINNMMNPHWLLYVEMKMEIL